MNDNGEITQYIVIMEDVTDKKNAENELRKSEASLREAQEIARMGDWEFDLITETMHSSENCNKIFGLEQYLVRKLYERLSAEKRMIEEEIRIILPGGQQRWLNNRIVPVIENGVFTKLKGVVMDITDYKRMESALLKAKERAEEGDKLKSAFLANIRKIKLPGRRGSSLSGSLTQMPITC